MSGHLKTPAIRMQIQTRRIVLFSICIAIVFQLSAVRAIPGIITIRQPDGTSLSVRLHGDERSHYMTTSDNLMLLQATDGSYCYATPESNGIQTTGYQAKDPEKRSTDEINFIKKIDQKKLVRIQVNSGRQKTASLVSAQQTVPLGARLITLAKGQNAGSSTTKTSRVQSVKTVKALVILVNFSDTVFTITSPQTSFNNLFNQTGYNVNGSSGSVHDFYKDNSMGLLSFDFTVIGPVTLLHPMAYYGANDSNGNDLRPANMVTDACQIISSSVDFSQFDNDGDGYADNVFIVYAGHNEAEGGPASAVWPHQWTLTSAGLSNPTYNGVKINNYACTSELTGTVTSKTIAPIGTFCHEFGHTLGLVDLYDTDYNGVGTEAGGLANWDLMSTGNYNNSGRTPPFLCAIDRWLLGWCETQTPSSAQINTLAPIGSSNQVFRINLPTDNEFLLLENRQQTSWDSSLNGHGMLVTHIDMTTKTPWNDNIVNTEPAHQYADLMEADGNETYSSNGIAGDPYPGTTKKTELSDASYPAMGSWYSTTKMRKPITDITENTNITFNYCGGPNGGLQAPEATKATQITDTCFVANWNSISGNNIEYLLDVYCKKYVSYTEDFTAFLTEKNAHEWSGNYATSTVTYNSSPCAIMLNAANDTLNSILFSGPIQSFSFWGVSDGSSGTTLKIEAFNGHFWKTVASSLALSSTSTTYTFGSTTTTSLPDSTLSIRFIFTGSAGNIYIDDMEASYYGNAYVSGYQNKSMGTFLYTLVHPVSKSQTYYYLVRAQSPVFISPNSNIIQVIPIQGRNSVLANAYVNDGNLIVESHNINNNTLQIYTTTGQKIIDRDIPQGIYKVGALQPHALYIVVINGRSFKVIF
ncbi:MAG: family metalloprotease domain protein [Bacteroidetes bacterium]|nr:family metalloprotease domain protein [Bacteroidota bacterium]